MITTRVYGPLGYRQQPSVRFGFKLAVPPEQRARRFIRRLSQMEKRSRRDLNEPRVTEDIVRLDGEEYRLMTVSTPDFFPTYELWELTRDGLNTRVRVDLKHRLDVKKKHVLPPSLVQVTINNLKPDKGEPLRYQSPWVELPVAKYAATGVPVVDEAMALLTSLSVYKLPNAAPRIAFNWELEKAIEQLTL